MSLVEVDNLEHSYSPHVPDAPKALRGIALRIEAGEYLALVGGNGSGKSTLALHLNALLLPTSGQVWIDGLDSSKAENWARIRQEVALVFQRPEEQIVALTVEEDVAFGPENAGLAREEIRKRVTESLARVGLQGLELRSPHKLSAGQKQRLAIAGVLALRPRVIVFDEATSMLDPAGRREVLDLLDELNGSGLSVIHITHNMDEAARASRIIALQEGEIVFDGRPEDLFCSDLPVIGALGRPEALEIALTVRREAAVDVGIPLSFPQLERKLDLPRFREHSVQADMRARPRQNAAHRFAEKRSAAEAVARVQGLCHRYDSQRSLSEVSLEIGQGECIALVGSTGSGKSTLLQHLNALFVPQAGSVELFGQRVGADAKGLSALRRRAGLVFQRPEEQIFAQYVGDEVAYGPRLSGLGGKALTERVRWAMETVGLEFSRYRDRLTFALSGGEQRKVGVAGVLALRPELFLLDEPGAGLDPASRREMGELIARLKREGTTIVLSTHDMNEALSLADSVVALFRGEIRLEGRPAELFLQQELLESIGLEVPEFYALARRYSPIEQGGELPRTAGEFADFLIRLLAVRSQGTNGEGGEQ